MNVLLPDIFDLSSLTRALDEDLAAQEHAAIEYMPMEVDDEWVPPPRPWYNLGPHPAWNNLELENPPIENLPQVQEQDVHGWYVNLRDQPWHYPPVDSVGWVESAWVSKAATSALPASAPPWYNPESQPAWNNLELENPPIENMPEVQDQDVPGWYVNLRDQPQLAWLHPPAESVGWVESPWVPRAPRPWYNPEPRPAWNNLELELENPPVTKAPQVQDQDMPGWYVNLHDQPQPTGHRLPVVSVRRVKKPRVPKVPAPHVPVVLAGNVEKPRISAALVSTTKARVPGIHVSAIKVKKVHTPVVPPPARKAGKARVSGVLASTRKAEKIPVPGILASGRKAENDHVLDAPPSARQLEKARAPSAPVPPPHVPASFKSTSARPKPMAPLRIDLSNMSSSSKVKLENMPMYPVQMRVSLPMVVNIEPIVDPVENEEPTVEYNTVAEDDVGASDASEEDSEEDSEEEKRKARVAQLMTEIFGDGEDSDDEAQPSAKYADTSLEHSSTSTSGGLTPDATDSITDWSLDTPDNAGTEGNVSVEVAKRSGDDEEGQANYRTLDSFFSDEKGGQRIPKIPLPVAVTAMRSPQKRKRDYDGLSPMPCPVTRDPKKRKLDIGALPTPTPLIIDPRKRRREEPSIHSLFTGDPRKRKREDDLPQGPSLITRDPRKRFKS